MESYLTTMRWWPERRQRSAETASLGEAGIDGGEVAGLLSWWTWGLLSWWTGGSEAPNLRRSRGSRGSRGRRHSRGRKGRGRRRGRVGGCGAVGRGNDSGGAVEGGTREGAA